VKELAGFTLRRFGVQPGGIRLMETFETIRELRILPCLSGLQSEDLAVLAQTATQKRYSKNEIIFQEQGQAKFFFIVTSGSVKLYKTSAEGRELVIRVMRPGNYFCCSPLFERQPVRRDR
jgi:CRP/FNR family transcriptional regulator